MLVPGSRKRINTAACLMAVWSVVIAYVSVISQPMGYMPGQILRAGIGVLGVIGAIISYSSKSDKVRQAGRILTAISVFWGIERMFIIL